MTFDAQAAIDALIDHPFTKVEAEKSPTSTEEWYERVDRRTRLGDEFHTELNKVPRKGLIAMLRICRPEMKYTDRALARFGTKWLRMMLTRRIVNLGFSKAVRDSMRSGTEEYRLLHISGVLQKPQEQEH